MISSFKKFIWLLRIKKEPTIRCPPFEKSFSHIAILCFENHNFSLKPFTSRKTQSIRKKEKEREKERHWKLHGGAEHGSLDADLIKSQSSTDSENNISLSATTMKISNRSRDLEYQKETFQGKSFPKSFREKRFVDKFCELPFLAFLHFCRQVFLLF